MDNHYNSLLTNILETMTRVTSAFNNIDQEQALGLIFFEQSEEVIKLKRDQYKKATK